MKANANGIELEYDTFGERTAEPLLLIMGLGAQMTVWDEAFCELIASRGFFVIRFDNRDIGLSTKFDGVHADLAALLAGDKGSAPYTLNDMADDAAGLLDALGIDKAHIVGASMGGMIAQALVIRHPERALSLTSIMSTTGDTSVGQPTGEALNELMRPPAQNRDEYIEATVRGHRVIGSPGFPFDEDKARRRAGESYDRSYYPAGVARQLAAILGSPDRTADLAKVTVPAVVIHGEADPLVTPSGGEATATAIPNAEHVVIPGMGHDLPEGAWTAIVDAIERTARSATKSASRSG